MATAAAAAISSVQAAIDTVASIEANVGAVQNQLNAVVANLTVGQQNLQSAYAGLVDVNFAQETTKFTTDQILMQGRNIGDLLNARDVSWGGFMGGFNLGTLNANGSSGC